MAHPFCYAARMTATIGTRIAILFTASFVGKDEFGNRYYQSRSLRKDEKYRRRSVIYNGLADPSKVPAHWHGWLHYTLDAPIPQEARRYSWQKEHLPNLTGTVLRYLPQGHLLKAGVRAKATADYQPWEPK